MCYFATIGISTATLKKNGTPKRRGFHLFPYENANLLKAFPPRYSPIAFTSGGCSCDICKSTKEKNEGIVLRADAAEFLKEIASSCGDIYLFIHWYSGDISTEFLSPSKDADISSDLIAESLFLQDRITKIKKAEQGAAPNAYPRHTSCCSLRSYAGSAPRAGVGELGRSAMKTYFHLISVCLILVSPAISAESPEELTAEVTQAFQSRDSSALANCKFTGIITGDIPLGRGLFSPSDPPSDPNGLSEIFPALYEINSIKLLSEEEGRSIEHKGYVKNHHIGAGYIQVDFKRNEKPEKKAQITAFTRFYPYTQTGNGFHLISEK